MLTHSVKILLPPSTQTRKTNSNDKLQNQKTMWSIIISWLCFFAIFIFLWLRFPIRRDRYLLNNTLLTLLIVVGSLILVTELGAWIGNFRITYDDHNPIFACDEAERWWNLYYLFIDSGNQHSFADSWETRLIVGCIGLFSLVLLNGFLISALMATFDNRKELLLNGQVRYKKRALKDHLVIIGGNDMVAHIIQNYTIKREGKKPKLDRFVLVLTNRDVEEFRRELFASLGFDSWRIIIYYGDRTSPNDIESLNLKDAKEVFVLGEETSNDDAESYHDTLNMSCVDHISNCVCKRSTPLICHVMFEYQTTFAALQIAKEKQVHVKFRPFNFYETWCQTCFGGDYGPNEEFIPLDGEGIKEQDDTFVHLVIVGMSRMGVAMGHTAAHLAHYPNFITKGVRSRITFIDTNADTERDFLKGRYHELFKLARYRTIDTTVEGFDAKNDVAWVNENYDTHLGKDFIDVEWEFVKGGIESDKVRQYLVRIAENENARLTVAVCLPESNAAVATAIYLPDKVYRKAQQVMVYQRKESVLVKALSEGNPRYHEKLRAFGIISRCYNFAQLKELDKLNGVVDKAYEQYSAAHKRPRTKPSKPASGKTPLARLWSNYYNILSLRSKMRSYRIDYLNGDSFNDEQLEMLDKVEHNRWLMEQLLMGYRPMHKEEQDKLKTLLAEEDYDEFDDTKNYYKERLVHLDICSNDVLILIDPESVGRDKALIAPLPEELYKHYKEQQPKTTK